MHLRIVFFLSTCVTSSLSLSSCLARFCPSSSVTSSSRSPDADLVTSSRSSRILIRLFTVVPTTPKNVPWKKIFFFS